MNRIGQYAQAEEYREQAKRVAERAERRTAGGGNFWDWYRAELQMEAMSAAQVEDFIRVGRAARAQGREVWEFEIRFI